MDNSSQDEGLNLNEWEQIQSPSANNNDAHTLLPTTPPRDWDMVAIRDNYLRDSLSFFPPSQHEDLPVPSSQNHEQLNSSSSSSTVSSSSPSDGSIPELMRPPAMNDIRGILGLRFKILGSGIVKVAAKFRYYAVCVGGYWSLLSVTGVVAAVLLSLLYARLRRWRCRVQEENNRLSLLIKEKDQRISQLLLQLARMNEVLSARHKVPVIRIR